jgi:hypothetical protein
MRFSIPLIVMALASWGTSVGAQAIVLGHPPLAAGGPSFVIRSFKAASMSRPHLNVATPLQTCPMPVVHTDSAQQDLMPVARGGIPEPMPVAKAGCWNPLDRR